MKKRIPGRTNDSNENRYGNSGNERNSNDRDDRRGGNDRPRFNSDRRDQNDRTGGYRDNRRSGDDRPRSNEDRRPSYGSDRPRSNDDRRPSYGSDRPRSNEDRRPSYGNDRPRSSYPPRENRFNQSDSRQGSSFGERREFKPRENREGQGSYGARDNNRFNRDDRGERRNSPYPKREGVRPSENDRQGNDQFRPNREGGFERRDNNNRYNQDRRRPQGDRPYKPRREGEAGDRSNPIVNKIRSAYSQAYRNDEFPSKGTRDTYRQRSDSRPKRQEYAPNYQLPVQDNIQKISRLNKYIANSGICSRREADKLIEQGLISINGKVISELGYKVNPGDEVRYEGKVIRPEKMVYVLLNKPKDFITTTEDPDERRTVMNLISNACHERIYPVGRLDRNTTGLLLFTNDGDLAKRLTHPSHNISKIYQAELDRPLNKEDFDTIAAGFQLEDGYFKSDDLAYTDPANRSVIGIEIHEGRNRLVRRVFEHFGYKVFRLDRVLYAGLTKKDLPRGHWRYLTEKEVLRLKYQQN